MNLYSIPFNLNNKSFRKVIWYFVSKLQHLWHLLWHYLMLSGSLTDEHVFKCFVQLISAFFCRLNEFLDAAHAWQEAYQHAKLKSTSESITTNAVKRLFYPGAPHSIQESTICDITPCIYCDSLRLQLRQTFLSVSPLVGNIIVCFVIILFNYTHI